MVVGLAAAPAWAAPVKAPVKIDMTDDPEGELGERLAAPPPDVQRPSLIRDKYRGVPEAAAEARIDDSMAEHVIPTTRRSHWLGLRLGGGMFDDGSAAARAGIAVGIAGRFSLGRAAFAALRVDWSQRGGDAMADAVDAIGASAGVGAAIAGPLVIIGQVRGELRLAERRGQIAVPRGGVGLAVGAEVALPDTPFVVGVRVEQGLTELAGARDRAVLGEIGIDL